MPNEQTQLKGISGAGLYSSGELLLISKSGRFAIFCHCANNEKNNYPWQGFIKLQINFMAYDFNQCYVPVFTGRNDVPSPPTADKAGNGAHLIEKHNRLVDDATNYSDATDRLLETCLANFNTVGAQLNEFNTRIDAVAKSAGATASKWRLLQTYSAIVSQPKDNEKILFIGQFDPVQEIALGIPYPAFSLYEFTVLNRSNCDIRLPLYMYNGVRVREAFLDATAQKPASFIFIDEVIGYICTDPNLIRPIYFPPQ